jgi:hypothetical protein
MDLVLVDIFHTTAPIFTRKMPYDAVKDFTAIGQIAKTPATTAPERYPDFPDVPTLAELGVKRWRWGLSHWMAVAQFTCCQFLSDAAQPI